MLFFPPSIASAPVAIPSANEIRAEEIADVIIEIEGRCAGHGQSGERGCFQFQPATWANYSTLVAGEVLPLTPDNERYVAERMIHRWLDEGVTERGIFLTWNQGSPYGWGGGTDCYRGVNKWGVAYDSCEYAARALELLDAPRDRSQ